MKQKPTAIINLKFLSSHNVGFLEANHVKKNINSVRNYIKLCINTTEP